MLLGEIELKEKNETVSLIGTFVHILVWKLLAVETKNCTAAVVVVVVWCISDARPGTDPIKILQRKFYAMQFFQDSDWLNIFRIQSECLKNFVE